MSRTFNALGKVETETDPKGYVTTTYYTSQGNPYRIIYPDGTEERSIYTLGGNLKTHISPGGTKTHYAYDFLDRVSAKKIFSKEGDLLREGTLIYDAFHLVEKKTLMVWSPSIPMMEPEEKSKKR